MFSKIRKRLTYVNVVMTFALVFAMSGGAFAAKHYLITSTKQISPKVIKALQGKAGPVGMAGLAGASGPAGATGSQGPQGKEGLQGKEGPQGKEGKEGKEGSPWTVGGTLPSGKTEKGDWSITAVLPNGGFAEGSASASVSFNIPLAVAPEPIYVKEGQATPAGCIGNVEEPGAEPGHVCVFAKEEANKGNLFLCSSAKPMVECLFGSPGVAGTADRSGLVIGAIAEAKGLMIVNGTWAVTAE